MSLVGFNCFFQVCAGEVGYHVGESPTGRVMTVHDRNTVSGMKP